MKFTNVFEELDSLYNDCDLEEAIFDFSKKKKNSEDTADIFDDVFSSGEPKRQRRQVRYIVYDANGRTVAEMTFIETDDDECTAEIQFMHWFRNNPVYKYYARNPKAYTYQRISHPSSSADKTGAVSEFNFADKKIDSIIRRHFKGIPVW
jgi:hypothetical protein